MSAKSSKLSQFPALVVMDLCLSQEVEAGVVDVVVDVEDVEATVVETEVETATAKLTRMAILDEAEEEVEEEEEAEAEEEDVNRPKKKELEQNTNCPYRKINSLIITTIIVCYDYYFSKLMKPDICFSLVKNIRVSWYYYIYCCMKLIP